VPLEYDAEFGDSSFLGNLSTHVQGVATQEKRINFRKVAILKKLGQEAIFKVAVKLIFKTIFR